MTVEERPMWGERHRREALRWLLRFYERAASECDLLEDGPLHVSRDDVAEEAAFSRTVDLLGEDPTPVLRLVRDLAEGRKVRERGWRVDGVWFDEGDREAVRLRRSPSTSIHRAVRTRRAP